MRSAFSRSLARAGSEQTHAVWSIVSFGLVGTLLLALATRHGLGLSSDSVGYLSVARNLLRGAGFYTDISLTLSDLSRHTGVSPPQTSPYVLFPPLYPALIAAVSVLTRSDLATAAWFIGVMAGGIFLILSAVMVRLCSAGKPFTAWGWSFLVLAPPFWYIFTMLWSETVFVLLCAVFLWSLHRYLTEPRWSVLLLTAASAAVASLTRYAGVILTTTGVALILLYPVQPFLRRIAATVFFVLLATVPLMGWLLRNWYVSGTLMGERFPSQFGLQEVVYDAVRELWKWWLPPQVMETTPEVAFLLLSVALAFGYIYLRWNHAVAGGAVLMSDIAAMFAAQYVLFMMFTQFTTAIDKMNPRLLSPVLAPAVCLAVWLTSTTWSALHGASLRRGTRSVTGAVLLALAMVTMVNAAGGSYHYVNMRRQFVAQYRSLCERVRHTYQRCNLLRSSLIVSNDTPTVYLALGQSALLSPRKYYQHNTLVRVSPPETETLRRLAESGWSAVLIWVDAVPLRAYLHTREEISEFVQLKPLCRTDGATFFAILPHDSNR